MTLDERVVAQIRKAQRELDGEGKLPTAALLDAYYQTFRDRFGPDRLAALDGEALLNVMHTHGNKDSLVYWLEFKSDEEFPTISFGSIAGGSAFKFGVFRRRETDVWVTGSAQYQQEITMDQAIQIARRHRDQLVRGVQLLEGLPSAGTDEDYALLQQRMDSEAPDVSDSAWGHKYFSLLFP